MKRFILMSVLSLGLASAGLAACDDSSSGSSELPSLSSDPQKPISEVTTAEAKTWCESYKAKFSATMSDDMQCTLAGLGVAAMAGGTDMATACAAVRDECLKDPSKYLEEGSSGAEEMDCEGTSNEDYKDCDATVAEFDTCFNALMKKYSDMADKVSCSMSLQEMMSLQGSADSYDPKNISECSALYEKCPEVFEDEQVEEDNVSIDEDLITDQEIVDDTSK